ncbi:integral membrane sensor signal transduction histidine kinase [Desulforamulus reducens MI-1]|uniref:histidine kinase n=1 Tax=Desulforamulus reducens (strain ATCC BAA-1160 / DSM 100696 / MI-1) TaxID=349161 RepID=A4J1B9_DESRM|nr:HAMP domain-containing sensor histidine kinase [Desulforamulus reducens]ABO48872.1 integral membrane sensor signal transduction histidine kinase [Desulforamulus reducens MI-1]
MKNKKTSWFKICAPNSLRIQLLSRSLLILAVLLGLIGLLQYVFMQEVIYRNKAASLQSQVMSISRHFWQDFSLESEKNRSPRFFIPEADLAFVDTAGNYFVLSERHGNIRPPQLNIQEYLASFEGRPRLNYKIIKDDSGVEQLVVLQRVFDHGKVLGVVQINTMTGPLKELLFRQLFTFLFLSLIALLMGLLSFSPIIKRTLVPLFNMVDTAEQIDAGNLTKRFPTQQGQMEIDRLADSFNGMLDRLEASFEAERETKEQMRRFIGDASHELRTPLTSIHGFLEVLLRGAANQPDQLNKALKSMYGESERMNKLVHDLLLLTKLDHAPRLEVKEGFLDTVIQEMEPQLCILAGNRRLQLMVDSNIECKFDTDKMKQVILNLFHNAVQHTDPEKGEIKISLYKRTDGVQLSVEDNGPGIKDFHLPKVFDRFYRIDASRTRRHGGAGLGLAITKAIIDAHGGTINVESLEGTGSTFHIWLPA